mgnify:CR=1 FL=1
MFILNFDDKWEVFKKMAANKLKRSGYKNDCKIMAECLDYSFEQEYLHEDMTKWSSKMNHEIVEFKKDCPEDFE